MPCDSLPAEVWTYIFDLATEEPILSNLALPTAWDESAWFRTVFEEWALKSPTDRIHDIQRRGYKTKKAIVSTCRAWRQIGSEYLFKFILVERPSQLGALCGRLDKDASLGWWSRRFHLDRYGSVDSVEDYLVSIIQHMPNLQSFGVSWSLGDSFGTVADALCTFCPQSLRTVQWSVSCSALSRVIWALASLPNLTCVSIDFRPPTSSLRLGSASGLSPTLPHLSQLSLHNNFTDFVELATDWSLPSLESLTLDYGSNIDTLPDIPMFLTSHGLNLTYLDLNLIPPVDLPGVLSLCPHLRTFCFNPDWPVNTDPLDLHIARIVSKPHAHIVNIGLHQLLHAFGVGYTAAMDARQPLRAHLIRRTNDLTFAALNRWNFPSLRCIRVLNRGLLSDLERANGPDKSCFERWERWWNMCSRMGVRLEDCTGELLGNLPELEGEVEDEDGTETALSGESNRDGEQAAANTPELRQLLYECRKMNATRAPPVPTGGRVR